jgi:hypothetical protein
MGVRLQVVTWKRCGDFVRGGTPAKVPTPIQRSGQEDRKVMSDVGYLAQQLWAGWPWCPGQFGDVLSPRSVCLVIQLLSRAAVSVRDEGPLP